MSKKLTIKAVSRTTTGSSAGRRLRRNGQFPGVVYGAGAAVKNISLSEKMYNELEKEAYYSAILNLEVEGKKEDVIIKSVQRHAYKPQIIHMDFLRVAADSKLTTSIQFHLVGTAVGVKEQGGLLSNPITESAIVCLPKDLPESIQIDISELKLGEVIHLSDIKLPKDVQFVQLQHGHDLLVATIVTPKIIEDEEVEQVVESDDAETEDNKEQDSDKGKGKDKDKDKNKK